MLELQIATKYLRTTRVRGGFISFISTVSILSLIITVMTLITTLSVMNGFHKEIKERILAAIAHGYITSYDNRLINWRTLESKIKKYPKIKNEAHIVGVAPYIEKYALLSHKGEVGGISVRGILPEAEKSVSHLLFKMRYGTNTLSEDEAQILIGLGTALNLGISVGDEVLLLAPDIKQNSAIPMPHLKHFKVSGIFDAGAPEYNNHLGLIHLSQAQKFYVIKNHISGLRLKFSDVFAADKIRTALSKFINSNSETRPYQIITWTQQKANFIRALQLEKNMVALILFFIIIIAAFNIVSMMVMVVNNKKADIAILKTMGMRKGSIMKIFFYQGLLIGIIGISIGAALGILLALNIETVVSTLEGIFHFKLLPEHIFYVNRLPSEIKTLDIILTVLSAFTAVVLSSIYPAYYGAKMNVIKILNYE